MRKETPRSFINNIVYPTSGRIFWEKILPFINSPISLPSIHTLHQIASELITSTELQDNSLSHIETTLFANFFAMSVMNYALAEREKRELTKKGIHQDRIKTRPIDEMQFRSEAITGVLDEKVQEISQASSISSEKISPWMQSIRFSAESVVTTCLDFSQEAISMHEVITPILELRKEFTENELLKLDKIADRIDKLPELA